MAAALVIVEAGVRLVSGGPYPGATALLVVACGLALLPFLPATLGRLSIRLSLLPALGSGAFMILLTTVAVVGIPLTELSVRVAAAALVAGACVVHVAFCGEPRPAGRPARREAGAVAALVLIVGFAFASAYDIVDPFPPPGTDWAYYLLYAEEVEREGRLLVDSPYAVGEVAAMGHYPGLGALYGSVRLLDGAGDERLALGIALISALTVSSLFAAVGGLWGVTAGLLAAGVYAVAPIRLEPMYWHGLATVLALVFVPLVVLALGLVFRGERSRRLEAFLAFGLAATLVAHSPSAAVVGVVLGLVLGASVALLLVRSLTSSQARVSRWRGSVAGAVVVATLMGAALSLGVIAHVRLHSAELGRPVDYRFFDTDWLSARTLLDYYSLELLLLVAAGIVVILAGPARRRDPAVLALVGLASAAVVVSELWRLEIPFEYRRAVYYAAPALAGAVGVASFGLSRRRRLLWIGVCVLVSVAVAREATGLRLPERLLDRDEPSRSAQLDALASFGVRLDRVDSMRTAVLAADRCLSLRVPYVLRRRTMVEADEWQAGFQRIVPIARDASAIVAGGDEGRRVAERRDVRYVLVDPRCRRAPAPIAGREVFAAPSLVVFELVR